MNKRAQHHIEPQTGIGLMLERGQVLRVIDPQGEQVSDVMAFARDDLTEWLSSGRTIDYNNTIYFTTGHALYSNKSRPMLTILEDRVGRHDSCRRRAARRCSRSCTSTRGTIRAASATSR